MQPTYDSRARTGALLGSFWDQSWFDRLCSVLQHCNWNLSWYGQNRSPWLTFGPADLARAHIAPFGLIPEDQLARELRTYPFVIVPVGSLDNKETNKGVAHLSLTGRILFAAATSNTPVLVIGNEETCGARFVKHFGIGLVVPYDTSAVSAAMEQLRDRDTQLQMRARAAAVAPLLSDNGVAGWLATSIENGAPTDNRFDKAFSSYNADRQLPLTNVAGTER
jgi:hypothetical protein